MQKKNSFNNPFSMYNANVMPEDSILKFWCDPFGNDSESFISSQIFEDNSPITFMGGRGSGKTMFLKYCSYNVQIRDARKKLTEGTIDNIFDFFKNQGGIGVYLRIDGPRLRAFESGSIDEHKWSTLFAHFFENSVAESVFEILTDLENNEDIGSKEFDNSKKLLIKTLGNKISECRNFNDVAEYFTNNANQVLRYLRDLVFTETSFDPGRILAISDISGVFLSSLSDILGSKFEGIKFVLMIDEYENFLEYQQRLINTLIKFSKAKAPIRLGMRLEGFRTFGTVTQDDFIKENRDYRNVEFNQTLSIKGSSYMDFVKKLISLRLETIPEYRDAGISDISSILGAEEDPEEEARAIIAKSLNKIKHFKGIGKDEKTTNNLIKILKNPENPLLEMYNVLLVNRGHDPQCVKKSMDESALPNKTKDGKKYHDNYINKYKLSLLFLLCSKYRVNKTYYSLNTIAYLSTGIVGNLIEMCRRVYQLAYFNNSESLLKGNKIDKEIQNIAIRDFSKTELEMAGRVSQVGEDLKSLIKNLGNTFTEYHTDPQIRYPETNQISFSNDVTKDPHSNEVLKRALEWSILIKKNKLQRENPSGRKEELFTLSRIFSPLFNITYRTRGGYSETYTVDEFKDRYSKDSVAAKLKTSMPEDNDQLKFSL